MMGTGHDQQQWRGVDEGWGRRAVDFATLSEPANCREYVALHQHLGVGAGDRLLDVACGSGLAVELAARPGRHVRRHRRLRRGWSPSRGTGRPAPTSGSATCTRCRGTTTRSTWSPASAASGARRPTRSPRCAGCSCPAAGSGSRCGATSRPRRAPGRCRRSRWPAEPKVANQAAMVALGRPGAGEELLAALRLRGRQRVEIPFAWEFADPEPTPARWRRPARRTKRSRPSARRRSSRTPSSWPASGSATGCRCGRAIAVVGLRRPQARADVDAGRAGFLAEPPDDPRGAACSTTRTSRTSAT